MLANRGSCSHSVPMAELRSGEHRSPLTSHVSVPVWLNSTVNAAHPTPYLCSRKPSNAQYFGTRQSRTVVRKESASMRGFGQHAPWLVRNLGYRERSSRLANGQISLAGNVSTILCWRAQPDDGEHSGRYFEHAARSIVSECEHESALFASTSADDCKRLQIGLCRLIDEQVSRPAAWAGSAVLECALRPCVRRRSRGGRPRSLLRAREPQQQPGAAVPTSAEPDGAAGPGPLPPWPAP